MTDLNVPRKHTGVMRCKCPHNLGFLKAPLDKAHKHINTRCRWSCCDQPWSAAECTLEVDDEDASGYVVTKTNINDREQYEAAFETKAEDEDPTVISKTAFDLLAEEGWNVSPYANKSFTKKSLAVTTASGATTENNQTLSTIYSSSSTSQSTTTTTTYTKSYNSSSGDNWIFRPLTDFFNEFNCFAPSAEFLDADSKATILLMSDEMPESMFRRRVAMAVLRYMRQLKLPTGDPRVVELVTTWVVSAVQSWIKVTGGRGIPTITLGGPTESDPAFGFLKDFMTHVYGDLSREDSLRKATNVNNVLFEQAFIDWYVTSRYEVAIVPPDYDGFPLFGPEHTSAMAKVLQADPDLYLDHYDKQTPFEVTLDKIIQIGLNIPEDPVGCFAGDEFSYSTFPDFFFNVTSVLGSSRTRTDGHMGKIDWDASSLKGLTDIPSGYVVNVSVQASRNLRGYPFPFASNRGDRRKVEHAITDALKSLGVIIPGTYTSGTDMQSKLLEAPPYSRDWPYGRGVFKDSSGSVSALINVQDHVCLSFDGRTNGILATFKRFTDILGAFETALFTTGHHGFVRDETFGYHTANPAIVGTGMVGTATLKIPNLMRKNPVPIFNRLGLTYALGVKDDTVVVSHKGNLGYSETELLQILVNGIGAVLAMERKLENNDVAGCSLLIRSLAASVEFPVIETEYTHAPGEAYITYQLKKLARKRRAERKAMRAAKKAAAEAAAEAAGEEYVEEEEEEKDEQEEEDDELLGEEVEGEVEDEEEVEDESEEGPFSHKDEYPTFTDKHKSVIVRHLNADLFYELSQPEVTGEAGGWSISDAIRPAVDGVEQSKSGILLGGEDSYEAYRSVLRDVISDLHGGYDTDTQVHPNADTSLKQLSFWIDGFSNVDEKYIVSAVIAGSRNIHGFPLPPALDRASRRTIEYILRFALKLRYRDVSGKYYKLSELTAEQEADLVRDAMMPARPLPGSISSTVNSGNDWPDGRGVFHNFAKQVFCWVNDEDHLKVFSRDDGSQNGGKVNLQQMMRDWARTVNILESILEYSLFNYLHSERLGFISSDPSRIGTAMKMSVILRLPRLHETKIKEVTNPRKLSVQRARNVASPGGIWVNGSTDGCWEISTTIFLGDSEVNILQSICEALVILIELEKAARKPLSPPPEPVIVPEPEPEPEPEDNLDALERAYIVRNTYPDITAKVNRSRMPTGSVEKYMGVLNVQSKTFSQPRAMKKKMKSNSFTRVRWMWIDHLTKTLHWSKQNNKYEASKEFKLDPVLRITAAPRQWWQSSDNDKQFRLVYQDTFYDFELPDSLSNIELEDWLKVLHDCAGFSSAENAANGIKRRR